MIHMVLLPSFNSTWKQMTYGNGPSFWSWEKTQWNRAKASVIIFLLLVFNRIWIMYFVF